MSGGVSFSTWNPGTNPTPADEPPTIESLTEAIAIRKAAIREQKRTGWLEGIEYRKAELLNLKVKLRHLIEAQAANSSFWFKEQLRGAKNRRYRRGVQKSIDRLKPFLPKV